MKPLTKKQRSISILFLGILFIFSAPIIVLYSLGYTLDDKFTIQKTGGIFVHSNIANSNIFVDEDFHKTNGAFFRNTLIQDLVPNKEYLIEVQKEGYHSWIKEIYVYPSIVSEGRVFMLPLEFAPREIFKFIDKEGNATSTPPIKAQTKPNNTEYIFVTELFTTPKKTTEKIIVATSTQNATNSSSTSNEKSKSKIELFFEEMKIKDPDLLKNLIIDGGEVSWIENENIRLFWINDIVSIPFYYCNGKEQRVCENSIELDWVDEIKRFDYYPGRNDVWIVLTSKGIYGVEADGRTQRNIQPIYIGDNLDFRLTESDRLIIKDKSKFFEINL